MLTPEIFDTLPDVVKDNYELSGEIYVTKDSLKVGALKSSLDKAYGERDSLRGQMTESEQKKADEIAQAKEDALAEALSKNDNAAATKLLQEKLADAERRAGESEIKFQERMQGIAKDKEEVVINSLASLSAKGCDKALKRLLKDYIKVDADTGETTYLNDDGSASSLNETQFISSLNENELFKPLLKGNLPSNSRGLLNGSLGDSVSTKKPKDMSSAERIDFKQRDPIGFRKAFNL